MAIVAARAAESAGAEAARDARAERLRRWERAVAVGLSVAVVALHAMRLLYAGGLWRDEAAAARLATLPLREVLTLFQHEAFPLLFPFTLRAWSLLTGGGDLALRAFGLLVGLAVAGVLWLNAWTTARTLPLLSLALLGFSAPFLVFGDAVRGYGLGSALILLTYGLLARMVAEPERGPAGLQRGPTKATVALTALAAVASVQVLVPNAALLLALCASAVAVAALRRRWRLAACVAGCGVVAALSLLPYWTVVAEARQWNLIAAYGTGLGQIWRVFAAALGLRLARVGWLLLIVPGLAGAVAGWRWAAVGHGGGMSPGDPAGGGPQRAAGESAARLDSVALFAALTIPCALATYSVLLKTLGYTPRAWYFLPLMAVFASALDTLFAALVRGGRRWGAAVLLAVVALVVAAQLVPLAQRIAVRQTKADLVAWRVAALAAPQDLVVVNPWYYGVSFNRYYSGRTRWMTVPDLADHRVHRYDLLKVRLASPRPIDDVLAAAAGTLASGHRVWLVGDARFPQPGLPVPVLPPAPRSEWGWYDFPYTVSWSLQLGSFLRGHAAQAATVAVPVPHAVSGFEDLKLLVFAGWRAERPTTNLSLP